MEKVYRERKMGFTTLKRAQEGGRNNYAMRR